MVPEKVLTSGPRQTSFVQVRESETCAAVREVGGSPTLSPHDIAWTDFFEILQEFEFDVPLERDQPEAQQERDSLDD